MTKKEFPPIHPGEILFEDFMQPLGISQSKLAISLRVPSQRVHELVHGRRGITLDTAARLARFLGTSAEFWINLQNRYDIEKAEDDGMFDRLAEEITPLEKSA